MNISAFRRRVGENIRHARWAKGLTQEQVAARTGSLRSYTNIERGNGNPTLETLFQVAQALNSTPAALLEMDPEKTQAAFERMRQATEPAVKRGRKTRKR